MHEKWGAAAMLLAAGATALLTAAPATTRAQTTPAILQITIERVAVGREAEYGNVEQRLREACLRLQCPNNYVALESVAAPTEVWWFVPYTSQADVDRVAQAYAQSDALLAALRELGAPKKDIVETIGSYLTRYRPDLGDEAHWRIGLAPFAVLGASTTAGSGAVFEASDGIRFAIVAVATLDEANAIAAQRGPPARVFAVRPDWSKPDASWVAASPELWRSAPGAADRNATAGRAAPR
jgi:hypothetical protein